MRTPCTRRRGIVAALAVLATLSLAACGDDTAAAPAADRSPAAVLTVRDPWVKAADEGMTAAFAVLSNDSDTDVTVTAVTSPASPMELHEMAMQDGKMVMRPKPGGFTVRAHGTHELKPGGDHLMLMQPSAPIRPGDRVAFTLTLADGRTVPFTAVAKPFAGAGESYAPGMHG